MNNSLPYWLTLLVLVGAGYGGWKWWQVEQFRARGGTQGGGIQMDGPPLEAFELAECGGQLFRSRDLLGKVWVTTFFFTTCPGSCPRLNANIRYLNSLEELHDVVWVSITVDPDIDTLPVLAKYARDMKADPQRWLFCRGDLDYVKRVGHDIMKLQLGWQGHQDYAVVIDRQGEVRGMFDATSRSQSQRLRTLLLKCLAEPGPEVVAPEDGAENGAKDGAEEKEASTAGDPRSEPTGKPSPRAPEHGSAEASQG